MKQKLIGVVALVFLCAMALTLTITSARTQLANGNRFEKPDRVSQNDSIQSEHDSVFSTVCATQPERSSKSGARTALTHPSSRVLSSVTLDRFRQQTTAVQQPKSVEATPYAPPEEIALIDPTNYGDRYLNDINGRPANLNPIIVLHETVGSANSAINLFQTPHYNDADQASYHALVKLNGTVVYLVPPDKRAFGAGNSVFVGENGVEAVKTHPSFPGSVNNFAYHVSLETPYDGNNSGRNHSGYTQAQYQSLAWLVSKTGVANDRITTHKAVDRSRSRVDPRSFSNTKFFALLDSFPKATEIAIRCTAPAQSL